MKLNRNIRAATTVGTTVVLASDLLFGYGMVTAALGVALPVTKDVFKNAAGSVVANIITESLPKTLLNPTHNYVSYLQPAFASTFQTAINNLQKRWEDDSHAKFLKANKRETWDSCIGAFEIIRDYAGSIETLVDRSDSVEAIALLGNSAADPPDAFYACLEKCIEGRDERFQFFLKGSLLPELERCFAELLLSNTEQGVRANKAYHRLMIDSISERVRKVDDNQHAMIAKLEDLKLIASRLNELEQNWEQGTISIAGLQEAVNSAALRVEQAVREFKELVAEWIVELRAQLDRIELQLNQLAQSEEIGAEPIMDAIPQSDESHPSRNDRLALRARPAFFPVWPPTTGLPVDISTAWGLNRGRSINILLSNGDEPLSPYLARLERNLLKLFSLKYLTMDLLPRLWYEVGITPDSKIPQSREDFWQLVIPQTMSERVNQAERVETKEVAPGLVLNFYISGTGELAQTNALELLIRWSQVIVRDLFSDTDFALIIRLQTAPHDSVLRIANQLSASVKKLSMKLTNDPMILVEYASTKPVDFQIDAWDFINQEIEPEFGAAIYSWYHAGFGAMRLASTSERNKFQDLYNFLRTLQFQGSTERTKLRPAREVVKGLTKLAPELLETFLNFVRHFLPERLAELIHAFASENADIKALCFAQGRNDLVDAWLDGASEHMGDTQRVVERLTSHGMNTTLAESVAFGIMRKVCCEGISPATKLSLDILRDWVGQETIELIEHIKDEDQADSASTSLTFGAIEKAVRAGVLAPALVLELLNHELDPPSPWWLLTASPPDDVFLTRLIDQAPRKRAVFGLCSAAERMQIAADAYLQSTVDSCRNRTGWKTC